MGTHVDDGLVHEAAPAQGPVEGLYAAVAREKVGRAHVGVAGKGMVLVRDEAEGGGVVELVDDDLEDFVCGGRGT